MEETPKWSQDRALHILVKNPDIKPLLIDSLSKLAAGAIGKPATPSSIANKIKSLKPKNPLTQSPKYTKAHTSSIPTQDPGAGIKSISAPVVRT